MRRWLKRIGIVLAVFVLPLVAFYFYATWQGERELRAAIAELDAQGEPWRVEDLQNAQPALADKDNVRGMMLALRSHVLRQFTPGLAYSKAVEKALDRPTHAVIPPEDAAAFDEEMQKIAGALAEAREDR